MAFSVLKYVIRPVRCFQLNKVFSRSYNLWTPDYLELMKPKIPLYPMLNIQIRGYDYLILQRFQGFINKLADHMDIDAETSWAMPPKELQIKRLKQSSDIVDAEYHLNLYERNIQITNASNVSLPRLVRILEACLPMGVILNVEHYDPEKELKRYVPDTEMIELKAELEEVGK